MPIITVYSAKRKNFDDVWYFFRPDSFPNLDFEPIQEKEYALPEGFGWTSDSDGILRISDKNGKYWQLGLLSGKPFLVATLTIQLDEAELSSR